jgi:Kdo2-lipid IVA lauroyltransferase/acyltransferase
VHRLLLHTKARVRDAIKLLGEAVVGALTIGLLRTTRYFDPIKTANLFGRVARIFGPMMLRREQRIGRANLTAAFPEKTPEEIETILTGVWDNLGRLGAEFAHLDHIWAHDPAHPEDSRIEIETRTHELFAQLRLDGKPALIFFCHLGNWELPAVAAVAHGLDAAILFRRPNSASANRIIEELRAVKMGTMIAAGRDAPFKMTKALQKGLHVAIQIDQWFTNGVDVTSLTARPKPIRHWPRCCGRSSVRSTASASSAYPGIAFAPNSPRKCRRCATPRGKSIFRALLMGGRRGFIGKLRQASNDVSRPISRQNLRSIGLVTAFELPDLLRPTLFRGLAILKSNGVRLD